MILPDKREKLIPWAVKISEDCRNSAAARAARCSELKSWLYTGSPDGNISILNRMGHHVDRLASYIFSPRNLRFQMDFTHTYDKSILEKAAAAARAITKTWRHRDIDLQFSMGTFIALAYGACIPKLMYTNTGLNCRLVMPWSFGVYQENRENFEDQEALNETTFLNPSELWRRISRMPGAADLYKRAIAYAKKNSTTTGPDTQAHQVLIAGSPPVVQTDPPYTQQPGGLVNVLTGPAMAQVAPDIISELIQVHELWVRNDETEDWTTIQIAEPDILIWPRENQHENLFVPDVLPYGLIRPNDMPGLFWGRSEMDDLMKLQHLLRDRLEDVKKLMSLQYDRRYAFIGHSGMTDEAYDAMLEAGYFSVEAGADVKDLTPELPKEWSADIDHIMKMMDEVAGFQNILSGQGEQGVRAGVHAQTLIRTASPRLRDRALIVERNCADLADKSFQALAAKEAKAYWGEKNDEFLLSQLPDDYEVLVDSHSSSPIYEEDHLQLVSFLAKAGAVDAESLLDLFPMPMTDIIRARLKEKQAQQQKLIQEHPELLTKGGKKH